MTEKSLSLLQIPEGVRLYCAYLAQYGHRLHFCESPSESTYINKDSQSVSSNSSTEILTLCTSFFPSITAINRSLPTMGAGVHCRQRWLLWWNIFYGTYTRTKYRKYLLYCGSSEGGIWNSILDSIYLLGIDWSTVTDWWLMGKKLLMPVYTPLTALRIVGGIINKDLVP